MEIVLVGLNHRTAPVEVRERVSFTAEQSRKAAEELRAVADGELHGAVFTTRSALHFSAEGVGDPVKAVADAENGKAHVEDLGVADGRGRVVNGGGAAGEDYARGLIATDLIERCSARENGGEDVTLADAASDELRVLRAEVENDDAAWDAHQGDSLAEVMRASDEGLVGMA